MFKICHMTSVHKSDDVRIFHKECTSLAAKGDYEVFLVAPGDSREENGVHVIGVGPVPSSRLKRMRETTKKVFEEAVSIDADLYHFHDPELLSYGAKLARMGKRVVFDSHENTYEQIKIKPYIPKALRGTVANVYLGRENRALKDIDAVIFPCLVNGRHPFEGRAKRIALVNNTPMLSEFYDRYTDEDKSGREPVVCHVGGLTHERGITDLIDACYMAGVRLILAGNFSSEEYHNELKAKASYSCVDYRGFCSREEVIGIYRESTIGASTLLKVGQYTTLGNLPTKAYEYMSMGLPVVLTDFPYGREVNAKYEFAELADPSDPASVARAIRRLADDPDKAARLAENGRKAIKEELNWEHDADRLFALYDELLG